MQQKVSLTRRQREVLNLIFRFTAENGYAPSYRELSTLLNTSNVSTAQYFVEELQTKGFLRGKRAGTKGIVPLNELRIVPLLGSIAAGKPIEPIENPENLVVPESIKFDQRYPHYALRVVGDSMIDMGILSNDLILIKHQLIAQNGDVVIAITEDGATLKTYKKVGSRIMLLPKNKNYPVINPRQLEVRGKFVGLIRGHTENG